MKKNATLNLTRILYVLFAIGTLIILFVVYKDIDSRIAFKFGIGYVFFAFFMLLYVPFITFLNSRKFKWIEIRKRLFRFIALLVIFGASNYGFNYFFRPSNLDLGKSFINALGLAFGIAFIDVTFFKNMKD